MHLDEPDRAVVQRILDVERQVRIGWRSSPRASAEAHLRLMKVRRAVTSGALPSAMAMGTLDDIATTITAYPPHNSPAAAL